MIADKVWRIIQRTHTENQSIVPNPVFWTTSLLAQRKVRFDDRSCEDDRCSIVYYLVWCQTKVSISHVSQGPVQHIMFYVSSESTPHGTWQARSELGRPEEIANC